MTKEQIVAAYWERETKFLANMLPAMKREEELRAMTDAALADMLHHSVHIIRVTEDGVERIDPVEFRIA